MEDCGAALTFSVYMDRKSVHPVQIIQSELICQTLGALPASKQTSLENHFQLSVPFLISSITRAEVQVK